MQAKISEQARLVWSDGEFEIYVLDARAKTDVGKDRRWVQIRQVRGTPARFRVDQSLSYTTGADVAFVAKAPSQKLRTVMTARLQPDAATVEA